MGSRITDPWCGNYQYEICLIFKEDLERLSVSDI